MERISPYKGIIEKLQKENSTIEKENLKLEEKLNFLAAESDYMIEQIEEMEELIFLIVDKINVNEEEIILYSNINRANEECLIEKINHNLFEVEQNSEKIYSTLKAITLHLENVDQEPLIWPTVGRITSGFGVRQMPYGQGYQFHTGVDITNSYKTQIKATADGIIAYVGYNGSYGRLIIINHNNNYETYYAHLDSYIVQIGQKITRGQIIGYMGNSGRTTGVHLHYEVRYKGEPVNPYYYMKYKDNGDERVSTHY